MKNAEIVACAIKRFTACWLRYGGNRHVLLKKQGEQYIVKEAKQIEKRGGKPVLELTGRFFELPGDKNNKVIAGWIESQEGKELEVIIASVLSYWHCQPNRFLDVQDATAGGFVLKT